MAYRLVEDLRNLQSTVWCDWQLMSIDDGWGMLHQTNWNENMPYQTPVLNKTRGFYCRKNVTNFIKVGYKIIETDNGNTLAALSPDNSELIIVVVNTTDTETPYSIDLSKFSNIANFKTYRTSGSNSGLGEDTTEKTVASSSQKGILSGSSLLYNAPAYSVTTFAVELTGSLSVSEFSKHDVKIYPMPFTMRCTFEFSNQLRDGSLFIYNALGKEVKRIENIKGRETILKRNGLVSGIYFYKLMEGSSTQLSKGSLIIN